GDAAILERERFSSVAEIIAAFPDVQIAVTHAGGLHLDQHLRSRWLRRRLIHLFEGGVKIGNLETFHGFSPIDSFCSWPDALARNSRTVVIALCRGDQWIMASGVLVRADVTQLRRC